MNPRYSVYITGRKESLFNEVGMTKEEANVKLITRIALDIFILRYLFDIQMELSGGEEVHWLKFRVCWIQVVIKPMRLD